MTNAEEVEKMAARLKVFASPNHPNDEAATLRAAASAYEAIREKE